MKKFTGIKKKKKNINLSIKKSFNFIVIKTILIFYY